MMPHRASFFLLLFLLLKWIPSFEANFKDGAILETSELDAAHQSSLEKAMDKFRAMIKGDSHAPYEKKLMGQINDVLKRKREVNLQNSQRLCDSLLDEIVAGISQKIEAGAVADLDALSKLWNEALDNTVCSLSWQIISSLLSRFNSLLFVCLLLFVFCSMTRCPRVPRKRAAWRSS